MQCAKCKSEVEMQLNSMYVLRSPSIQINTKGIAPGMIEVAMTGKKATNVLCCPKCEKDFETKEEFEEGIIQECAICNESYRPSQIKVTPYITCVCEKCISKSGKELDLSTGAGKYLAMYSEALKSSVEITSLLTLLLKKQ